VSGKKIIIKKKIVKKIAKKTVKALKLVRSFHNPIIEPRPYSWESKATLNPAAFLANDKIHLIYRAIGDNDVSVLGYASSLDGFRLEERPTYSIYYKYGKFEKSEEPINYVSGGGWNGGCEDPRVTLLDDTVYMLYTAFDGWGSVRIALTSIKLEDFKKRKWNWKSPVLISPLGEIHKNWVLFPEKINGKFAILHSISPEIMIDYFDSLDELDGNKFIHSVHQNDSRWQLRERGIRGVGPTPIKTELGWLILYHKIEEYDPNRYKLFAMILDFNDLTKILYRSPVPILEPDKDYENNGFKAGVIYSCGAVVKDEILFVYYGGADSVVCVATIKLSDLLADLVKNKVVKLKKNKIV
jgi:predicted GH43/DUF377 family glycosyl hydrolase